MYRASEQTEIAAVHENLRLKRENDVFFLQLLQRDGRASRPQCSNHLSEWE
jgi:hypothetical protein